MCDPEDLRAEADEKGVPSTAHVPQSPQLEEHVTDIETDLLWEGRPHPPRGDVPNRSSFLDYGDGEGEPQDQATPFHSQATRQLRLQSSSNSNSNSRTVSLRVSPST